jgi:hypothetical protein
MRRIPPDCCARATTGHVATPPPKAPRKSRRRMPVPGSIGLIVRLKRVL